MSKKIFKQILIALLLVTISTMVYSQTAYYWSGGHQINLTINNNKYFIVSDKADTTTVKSELLNALSISTFKSFQIGAVQNNATNIMNSKCWTIVETSAPINISPSSSIEYITPHFALSDSTIVGISNLFYVKLKNLADTVKLDSLSNLYNVTRIGYYSKMPLWWTMGCTKYSIGNSLEIANLFYESGLFTSAQPDIMCDIIYDCTNDSFFSSQWGLNNQAYPEYDINYCSVRSITTGSPNIIVAVFDSGIQMDHPDINNISSICYNIEDGTNTNVIINGHGTWCAGVIGATANNSIGVAGICPTSTMMSICRNNHGAGVDDWTKRANGFFFALNNNVSVINCSWHVAQNDIVRNAIDSVINEGLVVVASASNRGDDSIAFPASMTNVIGVGAIVKNGTRYQYSNYGDSLNLVAPGAIIFTTDLNSGYYNLFDKTSAATPHVSGVVALMRSVNPNLTPEQVKTIIEQTAQRIRNVNTDPINGVYNYTVSSDHPNGLWNNEMGYGLVDAHAAVMEAYFYGRQILGSSVIDPCSMAYPCNGIFTYNLNSSSVPSNTTVQWSVTGNLSLVSSNNQSISVQPTGNGAGTITITYTHEGYIVTRQKEVTIEDIPSSSNYYCNYSTTGDMTFNDVLTINGTFTINEDDVVTINGIGYCLPDAKIIVQPGGKLILDEGKLVSYCTNKMWDGIYVVGDYTERQLEQKQGVVEIKNGSIISNTKIAINTWDGSTYNTTGGIVRCSNSIFLNNACCAMFPPYINHTAQGAETSNISYFKNCEFTINDNNIFSSSGVTYENMLVLFGVNGIFVRGCHFSDIRSGSPTRGNAITLLSAGAVIKPSCTYGDYTINMPCICTGESRNTFSGFARGINAHNVGVNYAFNVFKTDFELCEQGVYSNAVNNYNVTKSNFNMNNYGTYTESCGIYSESSTGYKIEGNDFYTTYTAKPSGFETCGVLMDNSGTDVNTIYRNSIGKLSYGILCANTNSSLQILCNDFESNFLLDVFSNNSIAPTHGSSTLSAGNKFSSNLLYNFYSVNSVTYYHSGANNPNNEYCPYYSYNVTKVPNITANECEPTICIVPIFPPINPPINPKSSSTSDDISL